MALSFSSRSVFGGSFGAGPCLQQLCTERLRSGLLGALKLALRVSAPCHFNTLASHASEKKGSPRNFRAAGPPSPPFPPRLREAKPRRSGSGSAERRRSATEAAGRPEAEGRGERAASMARRDGNALENWCMWMSGICFRRLASFFERSPRLLAVLAAYWCRA